MNTAPLPKYKKERPAGQSLRHIQNQIANTRIKHTGTRRDLRKKKSISPSVSCVLEFDWGRVPCTGTGDCTTKEALRGRRKDEKRPVQISSGHENKMNWKEERRWWQIALNKRKRKAWTKLRKKKEREKNESRRTASLAERQYSSAQMGKELSCRFGSGDDRGTPLKHLTHLSAAVLSKEKREIEKLWTNEHVLSG